MRPRDIKMTRYRQSTFWTLSLLMALTVYGCGDGGSSKASVRVFPNTDTVSPGSAFTSTVEVKNVEKTFYASLDLVYDPNVLEYLAATEGTFLNKNGSETTAFQAALENGKPGTITIGISRLGAMGGVSGSGTLFSLSFRAVGPGTTALALADPRGLRSSSNEEVNIESWEDGLITVQ